MAEALASMASMAITRSESFAIVHGEVMSMREMARRNGETRKFHRLELPTYEPTQDLEWDLSPLVLFERDLELVWEL